jgi:hypothetical protein
MVSLEDISKASGGSLQLVNNILGRRVEFCPAPAGYNTAMTASTTFYYAIATPMWNGALTYASIRASAIGVSALTTAQIMIAPPGTAYSAGTAATNAMALNGITAETPANFTVNSNNTQLFTQGSLIYVKFVTQGSETLTYPIISVQLA